MNLVHITELLSRQVLFAGLRKHEIQSLADIALKIKLKKGQLLVHQGERSQALYVILTGRAAVLSRDEMGREIILNQVTIGDYIGELHVIDGTPHSADVVALVGMDVLKIERQALLHCMTSNPQLSLSMLSGLAKRLRASDERVRALAHQNVSERLMHAIKQLADQKLSTTYLAKTVGCSRETAARLLGNLQSKGNLVATSHGWRVATDI